jgi:tetratricopeptide (TPR) repeat protein
MSGFSARRWAGLGLLAVLLPMTLFLSSCGDDDDGGTIVGPIFTAAELNELGWEAFDVGEYAEAVSYFQQSLDKSDGLQEARLGLGWGLTYTGEYSDAIATFDDLVSSGEYTTDAYAGQAAAALATDPALAISSAEAALELDEDYEFEKQPSFDFQDLQLIIAEAHFALAQYAEAQAQVDILNPGNDLDPEDPDYVTDLALEIERLRDLLARALPA